MASYGDCRSAEVAAPPQRCFDLLTDFEHLPEWQKAVKSARVLERDEQGRGKVVEYEVDARFKTVRYRLRQIYDEPVRLGSEYLGGDFRDLSGEWRFIADRRRPHARGAGPAHRPGPLRPRPAARRHLRRGRCGARSATSRRAV